MQVWWLPQGHEIGVTYTHVLWGGLRVSIHWACYLYGKAKKVRSCSRGRTDLTFSERWITDCASYWSLDSTELSIDDTLHLPGRFVALAAASAAPVVSLCQSAHKIAGRHEKPELIERWARSYHESDPAAINLWYSRAAPCHSGYVATCALAKPLHTCLGAQSNRGASLVAPSGP